ncbi:MAG TPA: sigma-70 family RNA polymerase sigma factor [Acidimicrobiales bacterium]|nr:sigma-70 family RNA polymerase sigma factor [Acidimicrobiales bacterium]
MSDRDRLRSLVQAHGTAVAAYLRRRLMSLPASDLDDLVEETFVVAWRRLDAVPEGDLERPWLIGVARNVLHNAQRTERRRQHYSSELVRSSDLRRSMDSAEDEAVSLLTITDALATLTEHDRELLTLHYWDGIGVDQLSLVLRANRNAVATRLSRAKSKFLQALGDIERRNSMSSTDK